MSKRSSENAADGPSTPSSRVVFSGRRGKRKSHWSWLHATACSCAIVASGAYMHAAITAYIDALASASPQQQQPGGGTEATAAAAGNHSMLSLLPSSLSLTAVGDGLSSRMLPRRWLAVYSLLLLWVVALLVSRKMGIHHPIKRLGHRMQAAMRTMRHTMAAPKTTTRRLSHSHRRILSTELEVDEEDLLVVTSLSIERKHALPARARRSSQSQSQSNVSSATSSTSSSIETQDTTAGEDEEQHDCTTTRDAQIRLHPHEGASGGRHQSNQIIIDDPYVSRYHFEIKYDSLEKEYFLRDLGSTTGTFVFLKPDTPKRLHVDDRVRLGDSEFEVVAIDENLSTGTPFLRICFTDGPLRGVGQTIGKTSVTLGRRSSNALCITDDASISGRHSAITYLGDGFYITDLQSTNGTAFRLSACGVKSGRKYLLHGDVFGIGANRFLVEYAHELRIREEHRAT